jgi:hypothetical protein
VSGDSAVRAATGPRPSRDGSSVIRTALLTVASGGVTFLITNGLNQPTGVCITLSVLIGGIALLVRFLVDFENRLGMVEKEAKEGRQAIERMIAETFSEISRATELFAHLEASALQTDLITQLVRNSTRISPDSPKIVSQFVEAKIRDTADFLKQIAEGGTATYDGEDRDWLLGLTRNATTSIDAISLGAVDHDLWQSEIGQRYLDAQRRAAAEGKRVRRIFLLDKPGQEEDPYVRRAYDEQREMRIEVRLLDRLAVPPSLRVRVRDLIVFDDVLAYETTPTPADPQFAQVAETRLVLNLVRVQEHSRLFRELWELSRELTAEGQRKT